MCQLLRKAIPFYRSWNTDMTSPHVVHQVPGHTDLEIFNPANCSY